MATLEASKRHVAELQDVQEELQALASFLRDAGHRKDARIAELERELARGAARVDEQVTSLQREVASLSEGHDFSAQVASLELAAARGQAEAAEVLGSEVDALRRSEAALRSRQLQTEATADERLRTMRREMDLRTDIIARQYDRQLAAVETEVRREQPAQLRTLARQQAQEVVQLRAELQLGEKSNTALLRKFDELQKQHLALKTQHEILQANQDMAVQRAVQFKQQAASADSRLAQLEAPLRDRAAGAANAAPPPAEAAAVAKPRQARQARQRLQPAAAMPAAAPRRAARQPAVSQRGGRTFNVLD